MLLSDGSKQNADTYVESEDGFVRACWANPEKEIMLEVVNDTLVDGKIMMQKPAARKQRQRRNQVLPANMKVKARGGRRSR